jgi:hypothetical protein
MIESFGSPKSPEFIYLWDKKYKIKTSNTSSKFFSLQTIFKELEFLNLLTIEASK